MAFDPIPDFIGLKHVDAFVGDAEMIEDLNHLSRKSAHWKLRRSLHEQYYVVSLHFVVDELLDAHGIPSCWGGSAASLVDICILEDTATPRGIRRFTGFLVHRRCLRPRKSRPG